MNFGKMNNTELSNIDIIELIPQRYPFIMIDRLTYFDPIVTTSKFKVCYDNIFLDEGHFSATGLIENIAQTCAARIGYINRLNHDVVKLGFIGAIRNLKIFRTPKVNDVLETTISVKEEVFQMTLVDAIIKLNGEAIVTAEMKIALSDIDSNSSND